MGFQREIIASREYQLLSEDGTPSEDGLSVRIFRPILVGDSRWRCEVELSGAVALQQAYEGEDSLMALEQALCYLSLELLLQDMKQPIRRAGITDPNAIRKFLSHFNPELVQRAPTMIGGLLLRNRGHGKSMPMDHMPTGGME